MDDEVKIKIENFVQQYSQENFQKGDTIITPDKTPSFIYCLTNGVVRSYSISKNGNDGTMNIFKPISFFSLLYLMNGKDRYYYEALSSVSVHCIPVKDFEEFLKKEHDVSYDLLKRIYRGMEGYMLRMEALLSGDAYLKVVTHLLIHALRFGNIISGEQLDLHITHAQIAAQSGLSRETVTREIKKLMEKEILSSEKGTLFLSDIKKLQQELD